MDSYDPLPPVFPMCKLAEYTVTVSASRRRALIRDRIEQALDDSGKHRWWHQDARLAINKFFRVPSMTRQDLVASANRLRDSAAVEGTKSSRSEVLLASARAIEAFLPIAESLRSRKVAASPGRTGKNARMERSGVTIIVAPDLLFHDPESREIVGALKLHASQGYKLPSEGLLNAASILFAYLEESGDKPVPAHCKVADLFAPEFQCAPTRRTKRLAAIDANCEEICARWSAMYESVREELEAKRT